MEDNIIPPIFWIPDDIFNTILTNEHDVTRFTLSTTCKHMNAITKRCRLDKIVPDAMPICDYAIAYGYLELAQWLVELCGFKLPKRACNVAAVANLPMIQWLYSKGCKWDEETSSAVAYYGTPDMLEWILTQGCPRDDETYDHVAFTGDMEKLSITRKHRVPWTPRTLCCAIEGGCHKMIQNLLDNSCPANSDAYIAAVNTGDLSLLKILKFYDVPHDTTEITTEAASLGHLNMIRWFIYNGFECDRDICVHAARSGRVDMMAYLVSLNFELTERVFTAAAESGSVVLLEYLFVRNCPYNDIVYRVAAQYGYVDVLSWAYERNFPLDYNTTQIAAHAGQISALEWLWEHDCDHSSALYAGWTNKIHVTKWLIDHSVEITHDVIITRIKRGELSILKLFRKNGVIIREQECEFAIRRGRTKIALWIIRKFDPDNKFNYGELSELAAEHNEIDVLKELSQRGRIVAHSAIRKAINNGHIDIIRWMLAARFINPRHWLYYSLHQDNMKVIECFHEFLGTNDLATVKCDTGIVADVITRRNIKLARWLWGEGYKLSVRCIKAVVKLNNYDAFDWLLTAGCPTGDIIIIQQPHHIVARWQDVLGYNEYRVDLPDNDVKML